MTDDLAGDLADVVRLHPNRNLGDEDAPVRRDRKTGCLHWKVRIDQDAHRLYCRSCDVEVDPIQFLAYLASNWDRYAAHRDESKRRADEADVRLAELLRLEHNARARLRKLDPKAKMPERPWGAGSVR